MNFLESLFSPSDFMPHGYCYLWNPDLVWLHFISDVLIALAYFSIPITLVYFIRKRRDLPFNWMFLCFGIFILACGTTHIMEVWTLWHPTYWLSGAIKAITALASVPTAALLVQLVPRALALPSPEALKAEIADRKRAEDALRESEDRYRDLVEHSTDLICTHTLQGRLLSVNELPVKLLGYSREELLNKPMRDFLLPEARAQFDESLVNIKKDGFVKGLMVVLTKTGERRVWEYHNTLRTEGVTEPIVRGIAHDVTDQRRVEKALRLSEEKFSKAFHSSPVEVVITTLQEGRFLDVNESFERNTGFAKEEAIGHTSLELGLWAKPDQRATVVEQIRKHADVRNLEIPFRTKSGEPRIKLYSAESIEISGEQCLLAVCEDITLRKQMEEELRLSEEKFSKAFRCSPTLISISTLQEGRFLEVNETFERNSGYARDEIIGRTALELDFWVDLREREALLETVRSQGNSRNQELHFRTKSGQVLVILCSVELIELDGQQCLLLVGQDITDRKRAEEARRISEELFRAAFAETAVGFAITDLTGRFVKVNQAYCRITGYSEEELCATGFQSITHPEDLPANLEQRRRLAAGEVGSIVYQKRYVKKSGELVWVQNSVSRILDESGGTSSFVALTEDITERKRAEDALRQLSGRLLQLQDEERRKIAEDLHDSTGQDLVALATTLGQLYAALPSSGRKLRKLVSQCKGLADQCTRQVRTFSYLLHPPMLEEAGLEDAIRHYVHGYTQRTGIQVTLEVSPQFGRIPGDVELALFRVVQESLTNIQRHSGSPRAALRMHRCSQEVALEVSDEGHGIPGSQPGKPVSFPLGTGVGIPSMYERVKQIGGLLEFESSTEGTIMRLVVPAHD